ncbi:MAG TPA: phosphatidate cytidylyltransferase [Isosphaeraceae bacterium]|nr:phosphatidate cytidylyltransferase [Isosphaeraceae bacterium]
MLGTRLFFGLLMVAGLLLALCLDEWLAPWCPFWFLLSGFVLVAAARELIGLLEATSACPSANSVIGGVLALLVANWVPHVVVDHDVRERVSALSHDPAQPLNVLAYPFLCFVAVLMISFVVQSLQFEKPGRTMAKIAGTILAVAYVGLLGSFMIQMRWFEGRHQGILALVFLVATAKGADTGAYTLGRLAGRHKLWPKLSPHKTVEGAVGGLLFGVAAALVVAAIAHFALGVPTLDWPVAVGYGLVVGAVAQLGDLMESMIKRDCDRKDASTAVPGFGGVLDVVDSLIFAAPVAYGLWLWFGP